MRKAIKLFLLGFFIFYTMVGVANNVRPFIVDTDVGIDDVIAMLYLLNRTDIKIEAITIASTGNAHCRPAFRNTVAMLKMMKHENIPVACGRLTPLTGNHHFAERLLVGSDQLWGAATLLPKVTAHVRMDAVNLMIKTLKQSAQPVTILAIGPLTNIAEALQKAPDIKSKIKAIYIMGGAVHVPGNIKIVDPSLNNETAEWNFYIDPTAAARVLQENSIPMIVVPLDVTNTAPIDMTFFQELKNQHASVAARFVWQLLQKNSQLVRAGEWYFWDPLAAVIASDERVATLTVQHLKVVLTPEQHSGRTVEGHGKQMNIRVVTKVKLRQFKDLLLSVLRL